MLLRFALYGFLKNQRYFEPFLWLVLLDRGLGFAEIGTCVAAQAIATNLLEVPSGVVADLYGRRRAMVASFGCYAVALVGLALGTSLVQVALALALWGVGDAFRSGTHKAMIFDWLRVQGREDDRVEVYGYTRSWSKIGSAVMAPLAALFVLLSGRMSGVFWFTLVPVLANLVNLATYPAVLDARGRGLVRHHLRATGQAVRQPGVAGLLVEGTAFQGAYASTKDYLQPLLQAAALAMPVALWLQDSQRTALVVGAVYTVLYAVAAVAARRAHRVARRAGSTRGAARWVWWATGAAFVVMTGSLATGFTVGAVIGFIAVAAAQNVFRPVLVSRFDEVAPAELGATVLSLESQSGTLATALLAPALGYAVDALGGGTSALWPVGVVGMAACGLGLLTHYIWMSGQIRS